MIKKTSLAIFFGCLLGGCVLALEAIGDQESKTQRHETRVESRRGIVTTTETKTATHIQQGLYPSLVLLFNEGSADLSKAMQARLRQFISDSRGHGKINDVSVAAYADRRLNEDHTLTPRDRDLAEKRAQGIRKYLRRNLDVDEVETFNMATKPNVLSRIFHTDESRVKNPAPDMPKDVGLFQVRELGKPSVAVLVVRYEEQG